MFTFCVMSVGKRRKEEAKWSVRIHTWKQGWNWKNKQLDWYVTNSPNGHTVGVGAWRWQRRSRSGPQFNVAISRSKSKLKSVVHWSEWHWQDRPWTRVPLWCLPGEAYRCFWQWGDCRIDSDYFGGMFNPLWPGNALDFLLGAAIRGEQRWGHLAHPV